MQKLSFSRPRPALILALLVVGAGLIAAVSLSLLRPTAAPVIENRSLLAAAQLREEVEETSPPDLTTENQGMVPGSQAALNRDGGISQEVRPPTSVMLHRRGEARVLWTAETTLGGLLRQSGITIAQNEWISADGIRVSADALDETALPERIDIGRLATVAVLDGPKQHVLLTSAQTVAGILQEAGVTLGAHDGVEPDLGTTIDGDSVITVRRAFPISIQVDGEILQTRTYHESIPAALAQAGVILAEMDFTVPDQDTPLRPESLIRVVRVTEDFRTEDETLPYQTLWQASDELLIDSQAVVSQGAPGIRRRRFRIRYEDSVEVSQTLDAEWIALEPVNQVIGYGTRIQLGIVDTPEGPREYWRVVRMRATSYTAASSGKEPGDPDYGRTASGVQAGFGVVAIDRSVVPFRSHVYVPGYGIGFAGDTGGGIRGRWIDLGYDVDNFVSWSGYVDVYYLAPVPPIEDINFLLPAAPP